MYGKTVCPKCLWMKDTTSTYGKTVCRKYLRMKIPVYVWKDCISQIPVDERHHVNVPVVVVVEIGKVYGLVGLPQRVKEAGL